MKRILLLLFTSIPFLLHAGTGNPGDDEMFFLTIILLLIIVLGIILLIEELPVIWKNIKELFSMILKRCHFEG